jgi:hypothetical protein
MAGPSVSEHGRAGPSGNKACNSLAVSGEQGVIGVAFGIVIAALKWPSRTSCARGPDEQPPKVSRGPWGSPSLLEVPPPAEHTDPLPTLPGLGTVKIPQPHLAAGEGVGSGSVSSAG